MNIRQTVVGLLIVGNIGNAYSMRLNVIKETGNAPYISAAIADLRNPEMSPIMLGSRAGTDIINIIGTI